MAKLDNIILGMHNDIGDRRDTNEDRCLSNTIRTASGLTLALAIVADGVGGEDRGQRAAQLCIDGVVRSISNSRRPANEIPEMLIDAVEDANTLVFNTAVQRYQGQPMASTLTIAAVHLGENPPRLFVVNVGDSRVYLVRGNKLTQLTMDHNFGIVKNWPGELTQDQLRAGYNPEVLMRAMGIAPQVRADIGFYVGTHDPRVAEERGWDGLPLEAGDSIMVCSDGLIKTSNQPGMHLGKPYTTNDEIINTMNSQEGNSAAKKLVSYATGRGTDDNVSVSTIQLADPMRKWRGRFNQYKYAGLIGLALISALVVLGVFFLQTQDDRNALLVVQENTQAAVSTQTQIAVEETATATMWTLTPTFTPTATRIVIPTSAVETVLGSYVSQNNPNPIDVNQNDFLTLSGNNVLLLSRGLSGVNDPGRIFTRGDTRMTVRSVTGGQIVMSLLAGSDIFIDNGSYGASQIELTSPQYVVNLTGSVMGLSYVSDDEVYISCFEGSCNFSVNAGATFQPVSVGTMVRIGLRNGSVQSFNLDFNNTGNYIFLLESFGDNAADLFEAHLRQYIPTPTPLPDRDRDGIIDYQDRCPDTVGVREYRGCPAPTSVPTPTPRANIGSRSSG